MGALDLLVYIGCWTKMQLRVRLGDVLHVLRWIQTAQFVNRNLGCANKVRVGFL